MSQLNRLLRYVYPYTAQFLASVVLMALVGALDAFRVLLVGPALDVVLNPAREGRQLPLFNNPFTRQAVDLRQFIPSYFHNAWVVLAVALVGATALKAVFDYAGTYLVNYAGFGLVNAFAYRARIKRIHGARDGRWAYDVFLRAGGTGTP